MLILDAQAKYIRPMRTTEETGHENGVLEFCASSPSDLCILNAIIIRFIKKNFNN